jgi:uracil-DNA glycosylase family 4
MKAFYHYSSPGHPPSQVFIPDGANWNWGTPVDLAIVGQSPSTLRSWVRRNEVFGSKSWPIVKQLLDLWVDDLGLVVFLTNAIREPLPPRTPVLAKLMKQWNPHLSSDLELFRPRYILAVGTTSAKMLIGPKFQKLSEDHGARFSLDSGAVVVPTYHFSASFNDLVIRRNQTRDLERFDLLIRSGGDASGVPQYSVFEGHPDPGLLPSWTSKDQVVLDIETTGLDPFTHEFLSIGLRYQGSNYVIQNPEPAWLASLGETLARSGAGVIGHNLYFDLYWLRTRSSPAWDKVRVAGDTMLMALVDGEPALGLKHLTTLRTNMNSSHAFGGPEDPAYLATDLESTERLFLYYHPRTSSTYVIQLLHRLIPYLVEARACGVRIDTPRLKEIGEELDLGLEKSRTFFGDLNPGSDAQGRKWLADRGCIPLTKTPTGVASLSADSLAVVLESETLAPEVREFVSALIAYRAQKKVASGFVENYGRLVDSKGFLHPRLLLQGTRTGRLSSSDPNVQQVPRSGPIKSLFISRWPRGGQIGLVDLSQAELRCASLLSGDEDLLSSLLEADPHRHNASRLYKKPPEQVTAVERKKSKAITFGVLYGGSPEGLATRTSFAIKEIREAQHLFETAFPTLMSWLRRVEDQGTAALRLTTLLGRTRELESVLLSEGESGVRRKCANSHIQSLASDINLMIAAEIVERFRVGRLESKFLFLVHDSILLDIHPDEVTRVAAIVQASYRAFWQGTPLEELPLISRLPIIGELIIGPSWASVESTNESYGPSRTWPCSSL